MRKLLLLAAAIVSFGLVEAVAHGAHKEKAHTILSFGTMYGVDGPFVGDANPMRNVVGDESPWVVGSANGKLDSKGNLSIKVHKLVFKDDPSVPADKRGTNDESEFRGLVSCVTEESETSIGVRNVITAGFHATTTGNSTIHAKIDLPNPCVAPIVMVLAGSEDKWFAVSGFEAEEAASTSAR